MNTITASTLPLTPGLGRPPNPYLELMQARSPNSRRCQSTTTTASTPEQSREKQEATRIETEETQKDDGATSMSPSLLPLWLRKDNREVLRYYTYFKESVYEGGDVNVVSFRIRRFTVCYFTASGMFTMEEPREFNSGIIQGTYMKKQKVPKQTVLPASSLKYYSPEDFDIGQPVNFYGRDLMVVDADAYTRDWHLRVLGKALGEPLEYPDDGYRAKRLLVEKPGRRQGAHGKGEGRPKPVPYPMRDNKVLRFYCAYEDERKVGGRRQYTLYYYLMDDTIEIKENAKQGHQHFPNLLRRQQVPKGSHSVQGNDSSSHVKHSDQDFYRYQDLHCGSSIKVYGRHLLLLSCDASTVEWYEAKGIQQVPLHVSYGDATDPVKIQVAPPNGFGTDDDMYALGLRLEPGKFEDRHARLEKTQRGNKVLRFMMHLMRGNEEDTTRNLILNFFEFDQTISIYEPPVRNSGVDGGLFLARGKYKKYIEKSGTEKGTVLGGSLSRFLRPSDFLLTAPAITFEDSTTGARLFTLKTVGYDEYTRKILEESGMIALHGAHALKITLEEQAESFVSASLPVRAVFRAFDTSRTGTVSQADFISLVRELELQAKATLAKPEELDAVMDQFLCPETSRVFYDDYVDCLCICAPKSVLDQAKEAVGATKLTIEERIFKSLANNFLHGAHIGNALLRKTFRSFDKAKTGQVNEDQWFKVLKHHGLTNLMSKSAASTMLLQYDMTGTDELSYDDLCNVIFEGNFEAPLVSPMAVNDGNKNKDSIPSTERTVQESPSRKKHEAPTIKKYLDGLTEVVLTHGGDFRGQLEDAVQSFSSCFSRLARKRILRKIWAAFDATGTGFITKQQFYMGIEETAAEFRVDFPDFERKILGEFLFPDADKSLIDYEKLLEAFYSRDLNQIAFLRQDGQVAKARLEEETLFKEVDQSRARDFGGTLKVVGLVP